MYRLKNYPLPHQHNLRLRRLLVKVLTKPQMENSGAWAVLLAGICSVGIATANLLLYLYGNRLIDIVLADLPTLTVGGQKISAHSFNTLYERMPRTRLGKLNL